MTVNDENKGISQEYANFLNHYQDFIQRYSCCDKLTVIVKNIYINDDMFMKLFEEAVQAHINAINSYKKAIKAYQEFRQKVLTDFFNQLY